MKLYMDNGYVNISAILSNNIPFNFIVGGRATGKTYTTLKTVVENGIKFLLLRRTQAQADLINKPDFSPFKSLNRDCGWDIRSTPITKYNAAFYSGDDGDVIGYSAALSTISNMRGFDASDVELLIYDEFIPEAHERPIKNEGAAFFNAYETINRNRELSGRNPLQVICLANANDIANPIFLELGLVSKVASMRKKHKNIFVDKKRGLAVYLLDGSPISDSKRDTALYRLTHGSEFQQMALNNSFVDTDNLKTVHRPLIEFRPVVGVGELTVYQHKGDGRYYVSRHRSGTCPEYATGPSDLEQFTAAYGWLKVEQLENNIDYEEIVGKILLTKYLK